MHISQRSLIVLVLLVIAGCTSSPLPSTEPAPTLLFPTAVLSTETPTATIPPAEATATASPTSIVTPSPTAVPPARLPFARPILPPGRVVIDPTYRYGTSQVGEREVHNGVEFLNSQGTPVHAAASGTVRFAGDDYNGSPFSPPNWYAFYGLFVVLEHDIPGYEQPLYTLYAHLSEILVETGDPVESGQLLGLVGFTGAAVGSHLHFETRFGGSAYQDSRNPEAWLQPEAGRGTLVGSIQDAQALQLPVIQIQLTPLDFFGDTVFITTYEDRAFSFKPPFEENFTAGNLPAGTYELSFIAYTLEKYQVEIRPGELTQINIIVGGTE